MHMSVKTAVSEGLSSRKLIEAKLSDAGGFKEEFGWDPAYTEDAEDIGDEHRDRIYDLFNQGIALETQKKDVQELQEQDPTLECVRRCLTRPARPNAVAVYVKNDGLLYRFLVNIGVLILTSLWRPLAGQPSQLLLYTATWGIVDGTLQSQVQGMYVRGYFNV
ncbi:hypothetical protein ACOMHN_035862 [Nucella lapillus]